MQPFAPFRDGIKAVGILPYKMYRHHIPPGSHTFHDKRLVPCQVPVVPPSHPDHSGPHRPKHKAMNPHDFENLYKKVKNKAFKDDQMELLSVGVVNNYFTCKQTARLMSIFTWDDEKMKVLRMVSNRIVDRENGKEIIKTLDSLFKQDDARKILGITNQW